MGQNYNEDKYQHELGFAIDIDETLVLGGQIMPGAKQALDLLTQNKIPYIFVTNNISKNQQIKADQLNQLFLLSTPISYDQIILNITPLKNYMCWKNCIILIVIRENQVSERLPFQQIPYYITIQQYCTIFPHTVPLSKRKFDKNAQQVLNRVKKRLNLDNIDQKIIKFGAILIVNCPLKWEECYQVIMDLLNSQDGSIGNNTEYQYVENHIPVITALNNMCYRVRQHPLPRILIKPFNQGLRSIYRQLYRKELKLITYGKPQVNTFIFTKEMMNKKYGKVKKIVMIGDNQDTDIKGAYNVGWESILVMPLTLKKQSKFATYSCKNILEGLEKYGICKKKQQLENNVKNHQNTQQTKNQ